MPVLGSPVNEIDGADVLPSPMPVFGPAGPCGPCAPSSPSAPLAASSSQLAFATGAEPPAAMLRFARQVWPLRVTRSSGWYLVALDHAPVGLKPRAKSCQ